MRVVEQLVGWAFHDDASVLEHNNPIVKERRVLHILRDQQDFGAAVRYFSYGHHF